MSKTKSNIHSILCDYEFLYEYRRKLLFLNDFEKKGNKNVVKKNKIKKVICQSKNPVEIKFALQLF